MAKIQAHHSEIDGEVSEIEVMTDLDLKVEALFARDLLDLRIEPPKDVCSDSEHSEDKAVPKKTTPLKELFAESLSTQKECLDVLKDIRNQNSDVVCLLGLLLDQLSDRNDIRGSQDDLEEMTSAVKERHSTFNAILSGVPSNCKASRLKERPKLASSSVGPACKIAKIIQTPNLQLQSPTMILQPEPQLALHQQQTLALQ